MTKMKAEEFIEVNYHIDAKKPNVLICDKTKKEATIDEIAESYSIHINKHLQNELEKVKNENHLMIKENLRLIDKEVDLQSELAASQNKDTMSDIAIEFSKAKNKLAFMEWLFKNFTIKRKQ